MSKAFIGGLCGSISTPPSFEPISKVVVMLDDENAYTAGDDTGREIRVPCPYGTQEMANKLLAQLSGYKYKPVSAEDALIDPAAELGDAITVGGVYTVYAEQDMEFDHMMAVDVSAPGEEELLPEYSYQSPMQQINYRLAKTRSLITKTAEEIRLEVGGKIGEDEANALISTAIGEITLSVSSAAGGSTFSLTSGEITISTQTLKLHVDAANIDGKLTAGQIDATHLTVSAANIIGDITASRLLGGTVILLDSNNVQAGTITITPASSGAYAVELESDAAIRLKSKSGALDLSMNYLAGDLNGNVWTDEVGINLYADTTWGGMVSIRGGNLAPASNTLYLCGLPDRTWAAMYSYNGVITTSDRNAKNSIEDLPEKYMTLLRNLRPRRFKMNDGTSDRYHVGFIAQEVEAAMKIAGVDSTEFAGFVKAVDQDGSDIYMLRYDEFVALIICAMNQQLITREAE